jgi:ethanolamine ammonia-lyase large subunit
MDRTALQQVLVLANEWKEGDGALGGTRDDRVRAEARATLGALRLREIDRAELVEDSLSEALAADRRAAGRGGALEAAEATEVGALTIAQLKAILLGGGGPAWVQRHGDLLSSEAIAAVAKVMRNAELSQVARSLFHPLPAHGSGGGGGAGELRVGAAGHFGSRIQPNSPGDSEREILFSVLEGLSYGCGDVVLGLNPAADDLDTIVQLQRLLERVVTRLQLPTRFCVLSDMVKLSEAARRTRVDVGFQSLAGTAAALHGMVGLGLDGVAELSRGFDGLYFETGQGSEVTNGAAAGVDMVTLEARCYGAARAIRRSVARHKGLAPQQQWMIVNDVAGFIGPEVFRSGEQLVRACLEDTMMAKLHGLTMGLDVCSTFHMGIEPSELQRITRTLVEQAAPAFLMAVAGNSDPMLGYLTTSFRQHPQLRRAGGGRITSRMERRLAELGVAPPSQVGAAPVASRAAVAGLYAQYCLAGAGEGIAPRGEDELREEGERALGELAERGFDLGQGHELDHGAPPAVQTRLDRLYRHARQALYATLSEAVLRDACAHPVRVASCAVDREDYIAHPPAGEAIRTADRPGLAALYPVERPQIQLVISDGLNADAVNENLRAVLPRCRRLLVAAGFLVGEREIVVRNGRVRAGYDVAELLGPELLIHFIGERPGTGLDMLSAYLTYGRDAHGQLRWSRELPHSVTTAICGIHRQGKSAEVAADEIVHDVRRMLEARCSGVALGQGAGKAPGTKGVRH